MCLLKIFLNVKNYFNNIHIRHISVLKLIEILPVHVACSSKKKIRKCSWMPRRATWSRKRGIQEEMIRECRRSCLQNLSPLFRVMLDASTFSRSRWHGVRPHWILTWLLRLLLSCLWYPSLLWWLCHWPLILRSETEILNLFKERNLP